MAAANRAAEFLGKAVTAARAERGMKRTELAEKTQLSYAYLSEIEKGRKYPSQAAIAKLADALGMVPFELLSRAEMLERTGGVAARDPFGALEELPRRALGDEDAAFLAAAPPASGDPYVHALREAAGPSTGGTNDPVERVAAEVYRTVEPRMREWLMREIQLAVREELLRQREGR